MSRHLIAISYLEWLNWNLKGVLRVTPGRLVWFDTSTVVTAVEESLRLASDLEPADDGFLLAYPCVPPFRIGSGSALLSIDGTTFEALSERSVRLLSPTAKRMDLELTLADSEIQDAWVTWKKTYFFESLNQQARRIWSWAWERPWPTSSDSTEESLLSKARTMQTEMMEPPVEDAALVNRVTGTGAEAWARMILAARQRQLLASDDASWLGATNSYLGACKKFGHASATFLPMDDDTLADALGVLPLEKAEMVQLLAVATGEHHAKRLADEDEPDFDALELDLRTLARIVPDDSLETGWAQLSVALIALGLALPGAAVVGLLQSRMRQKGWAQPLMEIVRTAVHSDTEPQSCASDSTTDDSETETRTKDDTASSDTQSLQNSEAVGEATEVESSKTELESDSDNADHTAETVLPENGEDGSTVAVGCSDADEETPSQIDATAVESPGSFSAAESQCKSRLSKEKKSKRATSRRSRDLKAEPSLQRELDL